MYPIPWLGAVGSSANVATAFFGMNVSLKQ
jgi:hypothetical protein